MIKKNVEEKPQKWHEALSNVIWACQNTRCKSIGFTPFQLTYGHDVILQLQINIKSLRVAKQCLLDADQYNEALSTQ